MFNWLIRRRKKRKPPWGGDICRGSLKTVRGPLGFQDRAICPRCGRAVKQNHEGRFRYHKSKILGRDYLSAEWKGFC